jgi:hypothetical protein
LRCARQESCILGNRSKPALKKKKVTSSVASLDEIGIAQIRFSDGQPEIIVATVSQSGEHDGHEQ